PGNSPTFMVKMPPDINTGYVGFYDDQIAGTDKGIGTAELHDGTATLARASRTLPDGANAIHASYGGEDRKYAPNDSNVVTVTVGVACQRNTTAPSPPTGGAVLSRPIGDAASGPNILMIDAGVTLTVSSCGGADQAAVAELMAHPRTIEVGPGGAVLLTQPARSLYSAWGAVDVGPDGPAPDLFPGRPEFSPTQVQAVKPSFLLDKFGSCRSCSLQGDHLNLKQPQLAGFDAYLGDLTGADLKGADLSEVTKPATCCAVTEDNRWNFAGANLSRANLSKGFFELADFDGATVSGTTFNGADLLGADLSSLQYGAAPSFAGVTIGYQSLRRVCTQFKDSDLVSAILSFAKVVGDCRQTPLFPGSSVATSVFAELLKGSRGAVNLTGTTVVSGSDDRSALRGLDLSGLDLDQVRFTGFPVVLIGAKFDSSLLQHASFELANLAGTSFVKADLAHASFRGADLEPSGGVKAANFAGSDVQGASFVGANVSDAIFTGANLSDAAFTRVLAVDTDFDGVRAPHVDFNRAHIYGKTQAFTSATNLQGADFTGAVLAGSINNGGGFDLTKTDLTGAKFDGADCVSCNFAGSKLAQAHFDAAYLPGAVFSGVTTLKGANFTDAWLYCGTVTNSSCPAVTGKSGRWYWPLALGSDESYGPVVFATTNLGGTSFDDVTACPDGRPPARQGGCDGHLLPSTAHAPELPAPCSAAGAGTCPTATSTLFDAGTAAPLAVVAASPPGWATSRSNRGYYVALSDGTVRLVGNGPTKVIAGQVNKKCTTPTSPCGDGDVATRALLGTPAGLAVGIDGSLYIADPALHRVRRVAPDGQISTVAGDGSACTTAGACGEDVPPTDAKLAGPYGVWVDPAGDIFIADGKAGVREVARRSGTIRSIDTHGLDVRNVVGNADGDIYATTNDPDYLVEISRTGQFRKVVGTGTSGYNGNTTSTGQLAPGTQVQINRPSGLSVALDGDVVFADSGNNLVRAYVPSTGRVINVLGGLVAGGKPQPGYNGDGLWGDETKLNHPASVAVTAENLYVVADTDNHRVRRFGTSPLE
ncbi:MAG TPA: pentapeptide repeat-containing protein, partial [Acidimicrobiales bacterium]|nr:pentapeptide repeat-containing protein [Acidimicrobiales bacterium]